MSACDERPGRERPRADDLRHRRIVGATATGISPEVDPELWPHSRYAILWGWNPMSTAPHLWRKLLDARKSGAKPLVVDPFPQSQRPGRGRACDRSRAPTPRWRWG